MATPEKPKTDKPKTFDIAHPGKSAPSSTTRPLIVGHGPMIEDPMVKKEKSAGNAEPAVDAKPHTEKVIPVPGQLDEPEESQPQAESADEPAENPPAVAEAADPAPVLEEPGAKPDDTEEAAATEQQPAPPDAKEAAQVDDAAGAAVDQVEFKRQQMEAEKKAAERAAKINDLIQTKKYFVPINVSSHGKSGRAASAGILMIALLAAGAGAAYYFGLIEF